MRSQRRRKEKTLSIYPRRKHLQRMRGVSISKCYFAMLYAALAVGTHALRRRLVSSSSSIGAYHTLTHSPGVSIALLPRWSYEYYCPGGQWPTGACLADRDPKSIMHLCRTHLTHFTNCWYLFIALLLCLSAWIMMSGAGPPRPRKSGGGGGAADRSRPPLGPSPSAVPKRQKASSAAPLPTPGAFKHQEDDMDAAPVPPVAPSRKHMMSGEA